jgi:hypothetical protein
MRNVAIKLKRHNQKPHQRYPRKFDRSNDVLSGFPTKITIDSQEKVAGHIRKSLLKTAPEG